MKIFVQNVNFLTHTYSPNDGESSGTELTISNFQHSVDREKEQWKNETETCHANSLKIVTSQKTHKIK